jgi:hypothetical protein
MKKMLSKGRIEFNHPTDSIAEECSLNRLIGKCEGAEIKVLELSISCGDDGSDPVVVSLAVGRPSSVGPSFGQSDADEVRSILRHKAEGGTDVDMDVVGQVLTSLKFSYAVIESDYSLGAA